MREEEVDLVVVGSGVAGLCAATEARDDGLSVAVLEAASKVGGASAISVAGCCVVGTPLQRQAGVFDSLELAAADWFRAGGPEADMEWARRYLRDSRSDVYEWCRSLGIEWTELREFEGNSVPRWHLPQGGGPGVLAALLRRLRIAGVGVLTEARVLGIERVGERFRVTSTRGAWLARIVVMATGGFAASPEEVARHNPEAARIPGLLYGSAPTATGEGLALLADLGAEFCGLDRLWLYPVGTPSHLREPPRGLVVRGVDGEVWLNADGRRFHDETRRGAPSGSPALLAQPANTAWGIFDSRTAPGLLLLDDDEVGGPFRTDPEEAEEFWRRAPCAWRAPTLAELAERAGLPVDAAVESINRYNRAVGSGRDDDFGRPAASLRPIESPPFHAIRYLPLVQKTLGGVRTDRSCQVLGAPPGLFAAGELAGMAGGAINGTGSLEGTMFGPSIYSGRIAGRSAARAIARAAR